MVWETVARNYFFIFFSALEFWVFFLQSWSAEHCMTWCTLSLIRLYLDNIGIKCNYFFIFFSSLKVRVFFLQSLISHEMKQEMNVTAIVTYVNYVALKWCMTSPSYINRLFVSSPLFSGLDFD